VVTITFCGSTNWFEFEVRKKKKKKKKEKERVFFERKKNWVLAPRGLAFFSKRKSGSP